MLSEAHLKCLHQNLYKLQLPFLSLDDLSKIDLQKYIHLQSVEFSLVSDDQSTSERHFSENFSRSAQLSEEMLQLEWNRNPLRCLRLPYPVTSITACRFEILDVLGYVDIYVCCGPTSSVTSILFVVTPTNILTGHLHSVLTRRPSGHIT